MDIYYLKHSCFKIKTKKAEIIMDPFDPHALGLKFPSQSADIVTISHDHPDHNYLNNIQGNPFIVKGPGEYEIKGVKIYGYPSYHDDKKGMEKGKNTIFQIIAEGINIIHLGDLGHKIESENIGDIKNFDLLFVSVGVLKTTTSVKGSDIVSALDPKIVIPMHYQIEGEDKKYYDKLDPLEFFFHQQGIVQPAPIAKLHLTADLLPDKTQIIVMQ